MNANFIVGLIVGAAIGFTFGASFLLNQYKKTLVLCKNLGTAERLEDGVFVYLVPEPDYNEMKQAKFHIDLREHMQEVKKNRKQTPIPYA